MQEDSVYTELALNYQWVSLARLWLERNTPCSREKMFVELGALMPDTIRRSSDRIHCKFSLVKDAYRRIYGTNVIGETIERPPKKMKVGKGYTARILDAAKHNPIKRSSFPDIQNASTFISQLYKRGLLVRNEDGTYSAKDN